MLKEIARQQREIALMYLDDIVKAPAEQMETTARAALESLKNSVNRIISCCARAKALEGIPRQATRNILIDQREAEALFRYLNEIIGKQWLPCEKYLKEFSHYDLNMNCANVFISRENNAFRLICAAIGKYFAFWYYFFA